MNSIESKKRITLLFALLSGVIGQLAMDIYLPSMPSMMQVFQTTHMHVQLTYSHFMLGFGIAVLAFGFIANKVSYRRIFIFSNLLFLLTTLLIIVSTNIFEFMFFRLFQGLGAGIGSIVVIIAIIRLLFAQNLLGKLISYSVFVLTMANILSPLVGGYIQEFFGWSGNFTLLFILGAVSLILSCLFLPEIEFEQEQRKKSIFGVLKSLVLQKQYLAHILYAVLCINILVSYFIMSPFLLQVELGVTPIFYGWTAALICFLFSMGSLLNGLLLNVCRLKTMIRLGLLISSVGALTFLFSGYFITHSLVSMLLPIGVLSFGLGILYPNFVTCGFENITTSIALASSFFGAIKVSLIFINTLIAAILLDTFQHCAWLVVGMYCLLFILIVIYNREYIGISK